MTSRPLFSPPNFKQHPIRTLNPKTNPKQPLPSAPTPLLVTKKLPQKAKQKQHQIKANI
jgi:hypothetical protein